MRHKFPISAALTLALAVAFSGAAQDAPSTNEAQLDAILRSDKSLTEKDAACASLKRIATERSIPILANLLTDADLSHSARYALESMSSPAAGAALLAGLEKTSGSNQIGIIDSLAARRETNAIPQLAALLSASNAPVAIAAADAIGRIGGPDAILALQTAVAASAGAIRDADVNGLLTCANGALRAGEKQTALRLFEQLHASEKNNAIRQAAFRGLILASGDAAVKLATDAIAGNDSFDQGVALLLAGGLPGGADTTGALCHLLPNVGTPVQIGLLQCLQQRGDPSAARAVAALADSPDPNVRLSAIVALGDLGDGSVALLLAEKAAFGAERDAAHQALVDLRHGNPEGGMVRAFGTASAAVQVELIRALGDRGVSGPAPFLLKLGQNQNDSIRSAAFQALALIAGPEHIPELVRLVVAAADENARTEAADSLTAVCQHLEAKFGRCDAQPIADAVRSAPSTVRLPLLAVCAALVESPTREALRSTLNDSDPNLRDAAKRALCDTRDGALLPDLLELTKIQDNRKISVLALRGVVRLTTQEDSVHFSNDEKIRTFAQILALPLSADEKRAVLSGLAAINDKRAFALINPLVDDPVVAPEAAQAVIRVANATAAEHAPEASEALKKILTLSAVSDAERQGARDALKAIQ